MSVLGGSGFFGPLSPTTHLIESWFPKPVFPQQQWLGHGGHQGAVFIGFVPPVLGPVTLLGTQVEEQREDGSHTHHQQGQVLGRRAEVSNGSARLGGSGVRGLKCSPDLPGTQAHPGLPAGHPHLCPVHHEQSPASAAATRLHRTR